MTARTDLEKDKRHCASCGWRGRAKSVVLVNYKDETTWEVCPRCDTPEQINIVCDEPNCESDVSCGSPTLEDGYRWTCHVHAGWYTEQPNVDV